MKKSTIKTPANVTPANVTPAPVDAVLSRVPVVAEKDTTPAPEKIDAAPMNTTNDGAPVVDASPVAKTPAEITAENKKNANDAAREKYLKKYRGKPADALRARNVDENGKPVSDYVFTFSDADGKKCNGRGIVRVSALLTTDAAKTFRENVAEIEKRVVPFHNARNAGTDAAGQEMRAAAKKDVSPFIVAALNLCGYPVTAENVKTCDISAIIETAYISNGNGNDDARRAAIPAAVEGVARGRLLGYERRDDNAARRERKTAEKDAKKAAKNAAAAAKPAKKRAKKANAAKK